MGFQSKIVPEVILSVEEVTVNFNGFKALDSLNYSMERGELRVVIGPNGAGKTTLLDVVTGKIQPTSGRVFYQAKDGLRQDITRKSQESIARLGIGRKFQTPNVFRSLGVEENLQLALKARRGVLAALNPWYTPTGGERVDEILETIGLGNKRHRLAGILAHGE